MAKTVKFGISPFNRYDQYEFNEMDPIATQRNAKYKEVPTGNNEKNEVKTFFLNDEQSTPVNLAEICGMDADCGE